MVRMSDTVQDTEELNTKSCVNKSGLLKDEEAAVEIQFSPPLYQQRYNMAINYLTQHCIESLVDFGCAECGFFKLLPTIPNLETVSLVDVDRTLLVNKKGAIEPELRHFIYRRPKPLCVQVYAGSAADFDSRTADCEAVTLIEVIEHLHFDVLDQVMQNVFGSLRPKLCIVTTPNSEFNPLFQNSDPNSFRHWDHKFEWTRVEFQTWCEKICCDYGYHVEHTGVGYLPSKPETFHLGPCSQAAIFTPVDKDAEGHTLSDGDVRRESKTPYELIAESSFPFETRQRTQEEIIDQEIYFYMRQLAALKRQGMAREDFTIEIFSDVNEGEEDEDKFSISIDQIALLRRLKDQCDTEKIKERLQVNGFQLSDDGMRVAVSVVAILGAEEDEEDFHFGDNNNDDQFEERGDTEIWSDAHADGGSLSTTGIQWESDWDLTSSAVTG